MGKKPKTTNSAWFAKLLGKLNKLNRSVKLSLVLSVMLAMTALFAVSFSNSTTPNSTELSSEPQEEVVEIDTADSVTATLSTVQGTVEYRSDNIWSNAELDMEITEGMSLKTTGASSRAIVQLADGSEARLDANSEITFETLTITRIVLLHNDGHLFNRVVPSDDRTYAVQMKNSQFQAIGTAFLTTSSGDEESTEVYHGKVQETTINQEATEGDKITVKDFRDHSHDGNKTKIDIEQLKQNAFVLWNKGIDEKHEVFKAQLGFLSDFDGPIITIIDPAPNSTIDVPSNVAAGEVVVSGSTEKGTKSLTIQSKSQAGSIPILVNVDEQGNFSTPQITAPLGTSVFEFVAFDKVGNKTTKNFNYVFREKSTVQQKGIILTLDQSTPNKLKFKWSLIGMKASDGVQLIYDNNKDTEYPDGTTHNNTSGSIQLPISGVKNNGDLYFKVCRYNKDEDSCDVYSNVIKVDTDNL